MNMTNLLRHPHLQTTVKALAVATIALFATAAWSLNLGQAKSTGLVGETPAGYLKPVGSPTAEVTALVSRINAERKAAYEKIAKKNGTSLKNVEALAGKKAIEKSAAGEYILVGGSWKQK